VEKLVDSGVSKAPSREGVPVRVRPPALLPALLVLATSVGLAQTGCKRESAETSPSAKPAPCPEAPACAPARVDDRGDVRVRFAPAQKSIYRGLHEKLGPALAAPVADLNERLAWPSDIAVVFRECGEINAFYEPKGPEVVLCRELVDHLVDVFDPLIQDQEVADRMAIGATVFIVLHELGHALVDAHDIPVTGREEDAVDQLATWLLVARGEEGEELALDAASWFAIAHGGTRAAKGMLWDEHSLDEQRFYNIACWVYGADPVRYRYLVEEGHLPAKRAEYCPAEYRDFASSWERLLAAVIK